MTKYPSGIYDCSLTCPKCGKENSLRMSWIEYYCASRPIVEVDCRGMSIDINPGGDASYDGVGDEKLACDEKGCDFELTDWDEIEKLLFSQILEAE